MIIKNYFAKLISISVTTLCIFIGTISVFGATAPSSLVGGPRLYISNNTKYSIIVSGVTWSAPNSGYWFRGIAGSNDRSYTLSPRSSMSTPGPSCSETWQEAARGEVTTCFWGNTKSKAYNESQRLTINSDAWPKANKDGIKIDVTKVRQGSKHIFELEPDCKLDSCPVIEWYIEWAGDGWRITLNEETIEN